MFVKLIMERMCNESFTYGTLKMLEVVKALSFTS